MKKLWDLRKVLSTLEAEGQGCSIVMEVTRLLLLGSFYYISLYSGLGCIEIWIKQCNLSGWYFPYFYSNSLYNIMQQHQKSYRYETIHLQVWISNTSVDVLKMVVQHIFRKNCCIWVEWILWILSSIFPAIL